MLKLCLLVAWSLQLCLNGGTTSEVILALQHGEQLVPIDTLLPNHAGCVVFSGDTPLANGQYAFIQDRRRLFNFLISSPEDQEITFTATLNQGRTEEIAQHGSEENQAYFRFYQFLQEQYYRLDKVVEEATDSAKAIKEVERLENTSREYCQFLAERYQGLMLGLIAQNIFTPTVEPQDAALHYLDYVDFTNPDIVNTSILPLRLSEYITQVIPPVRDSLIFHIDRLLQGPIHPRVGAYCAQYLFTQFFASEIMGMEAVAVHVAEQYFMNGTYTWPNSDEQAEMETYVLFNRQCLTGQKAPALSLPDAQGCAHDLHALSSPYTLVFFFEDGCPTCSSEILKLTAFYKTYQGPELHVYAVYVQDKEEVLQRYTEYFPDTWTTVWDPTFDSDFQHKFNVRGTPRMFLLDRNKTIIGRDIGTETLQQILADAPAEQESVTEARPKLPQTPNLMLTTENGESISLYDVQAAHTILYLYDPACAHCAVTTHELYQLFEKNKEKDIQVFAVYTGHDYTSWRIWLAEGGYTDWINVWDAQDSGQITKSYNITEPPVLFILDKDKGIESDHLDIGSLSYIVTELIP